MEKLLFLPLLLIFESLSGQIDVTNDGLLFVNDDQLIHINGNFSNYSSEFTNRGIFGLTGNLINEARVYNPGAGIFRLYGGQEQTLFLYQSFSSYDLEIDNPDRVTLMGSSSLQLFNHLDFIEGRFFTNFSSLISFEPLATYSNASDFSHINGPMRRIGMTDFTFPVGKGGFLRAPSITEQTSIGRYQVEYFNTGHPNQTVDHTLSRVNDQEYWEMRQIEGDASATVTIPYDVTSGEFPILEDLELAFLDTISWTRLESTDDGASPMLGLSSADLINDFGFFTTAEKRSLRDQIQIAVEQNEECRTAITWLVPPQFVATKYEVERSFDSLSFLKIGEVEGDSLPSNDFVLKWYYDLSLYQEKELYFRVKVFFSDGTSVYTNIAGLENQCIFEDCTLFPNPVASGENIFIRMESEIEQNMAYTVWSTLGREIISGDLGLRIGSHQYTIPIKESRLPSATYYLSIGPRKSLKFVVINQ